MPFSSLWSRNNGRQKQNFSSLLLEATWCGRKDISVGITQTQIQIPSLISCLNWSIFLCSLSFSFFIWREKQYLCSNIKLVNMLKICSQFIKLSVNVNFYLFLSSPTHSITFVLFLLLQITYATFQFPLLFKLNHPSLNSLNPSLFQAGTFINSSWGISQHSRFSSSNP